MNQWLIWKSDFFFLIFQTIIFFSGSSSFSEGIQIGVDRRALWRKDNWTSQIGDFFWKSRLESVPCTGNGNCTHVWRHSFWRSQWGTNLWLSGNNLLKKVKLAGKCSVYRKRQLYLSFSKKLMTKQKDVLHNFYFYFVINLLAWPIWSDNLFLAVMPEGEKHWWG